MSNVGVLRKGLQQILTPRGMELQYDFTGNNQGGPPTIGGQGQMSALTQTPADASGNFQYQAPTIDDKGTQRMGDIYGATGLNQRMDLANAPETEEGNRTALAQQKVFNVAGQAGQEAQRNREVLGNMFGGIGALVSLANAGASGQDAFTGGMGAMGAYQSTAGQIGATSRGAGEKAARRAARKVAVAQPTPEPQPADNPQVAAPTPAPKLTQEQKDQSRRFSADKSRNPTDEAAAQANYNVGVLYSGRDASQNIYPADDYHGALSRQRIGEQQQRDWDAMDMPPANFTGTTGYQTSTASPTPNTFATGSNPVGQLNLHGDVVQPQNQQIPGINEPQVAEATPQQSGAAIANELNTQGQLPGAPDPTESGKIIAENEEAAKKTDTDASMAGNSMVGKMVGVIGSKRIVGVI